MRSFSVLVPLLISALAILSPSVFRLVCGCSMQSADVTYMADKQQAGYYNPAQVSAHINQVMASNLDRYFRDGMALQP